jgi:enterochelin esterase-like enzyme
VCIEWHSARLGNSRRIWVYTTGEAVAAERPLAVLLDGQFWAESMPVWSALAGLTREAKLPPAVYLLIDVIDNEHRSRELPCHADFWLAVQEELCLGYSKSRLLATAPIAPWSPGRALAAWRRCLPRCTGRSALAAC